MNNFDLHRFLQALQCYFMTSRRQWLRYFGIFTLVMFMADLFFTRLNGTSYDSMVEQWGMDDAILTYTRYIEGAAGFGFIFLSITMLVGASMLFSHMKETRQRTTFLMWPVSNLEKYLVVLVHNILLLGIGTIAAYHVADVLRVLLDWTTGRVVVWGVPHFWGILYQAFGGSAHWGLTVFVVGLCLWLHSLYILGGSLFRRQQFLLTSIVIVIGFFLLVWMGHALWQMMQMDDGDRFIFFGIVNGVWTANWLSHVVIIVEYVLTALHYWLSYKLFCRMQVINNNWLNV